jgi:hypothetical protein
VGGRGQLRRTTRNFSGIGGSQDNAKSLTKAVYIFQQIVDKEIVQEIVTEKNC